MSEIFKISKDERRAEALKEMAQERLKDISNLKAPYRILEEYYEIIKELLTSFMYRQGWKTLSHKEMIEFASENIKVLTKGEIQLIDELRIKRNGIVYYGERVSLDFLKSRELSIKRIIHKLLKL